MPRHFSNMSPEDIARWRADIAAAREARAQQEMLATEAALAYVRQPLLAPYDARIGVFLEGYRWLSEHVESGSVIDAGGVCTLLGSLVEDAVNSGHLDPEPWLAVSELLFMGAEDLRGAAVGRVPSIRADAPIKGLLDFAIWLETVFTGRVKAETRDDGQLTAAEGLEAIMYVFQAAWASQRPVPFIPRVRYLDTAVDWMRETVRSLGEDPTRAGEFTGGSWDGGDTPFSWAGQG